MKKLTLLPALLGLLLSFHSQAANIERVRVTTNLGAFVIEMQRDRAPLTVENFLGYVRADGYHNTLFHRVIANFVVQGGGVNTEYKPAPTSKPIANEAGNGLKNLRGTVGLARASGPHSGDRQIYINVADNADLDPPAHALGIRGLRPRGRRHGSRGSHQRVTHGLDGALQAGSADAGRDHPEDGTADRRFDAVGQARAGGHSAHRCAAGSAGRCAARDAAGNASDTAGRTDDRCATATEVSLARHSLFASDLHLDSEAPWAIDAFLAFLDGPARDAESLYLLGDLFEVWVGDDDDNPDNARACAGLARLTASGVAVYVLHGNRDFLLGEAFAKRTGVKLLPDPVLLDLYGVPTLLSHGDVFCTEDPAYQSLRSIVRQPEWQRKFLALPLAARRDLASAARAGSKAHTQRTIPTIMDVNPEAVTRAMRATGARRLIHGHTHRPAVHPFVVDGVDAERVVLAPWYEAASCVGVNAEGVREIPLPR